MKTSTSNPIAAAFFKWILTMLAGMLTLHLVVRYNVELAGSIDWIIGHVTQSVIQLWQWKGITK